MDWSGCVWGLGRGWRQQGACVRPWVVQHDFLSICRCVLQLLPFPTRSAPPAGPLTGVCLLGCTGSVATTRAAFNIWRLCPVATWYVAASTSRSDPGPTCASTKLTPSTQLVIVRLDGGGATPSGEGHASCVGVQIHICVVQRWIILPGTHGEWPWHRCLHAAHSAHSSLPTLQGK